MRNSQTRALKLPTMLVGLCLVSVAPLSAQPSGVPRSADGHPDLSGTWDNGAGIDFVQPTKKGESVCIFGCPGGGALPLNVPAPSTPQYRPEFAARVADLDKRQVAEDPVLRCVAPGVPRIGPPDKIVQRAGEAVFLYEDVSGSFFRIVPTDGRPHPTSNEPSFLGDAVGHWEGDTLVVETSRFRDEIVNNSFNCCRGGGANLRVVERFKRTGGDTIDYRYTVEDPTTWTRPWTVSVPMTRSDGPIYEYACHEGNYGMFGILSGARAQEKAAAATRGSK
jgi:hypothetical protein